MQANGKTHTRNRAPTRHKGDEGLHIMFYTEAVQNDGKSKEAGRPVFDEVEMIEIRIPLDATNIFRGLVTDDYRERFADEYEAFVQNLDLSVSGTPLEHWSALTKSQVASLKVAGVATVESLVHASDANLKQIMGGQELRAKAKAFLEAAEDTALVEKQAAEINELREAIKALQVESTRRITEEAPAATDKKSK